MALLRQPFLQFLALGALIFALYGVFGARAEDEARAGPGAEIVVDRAFVRGISDAWKAKRMRLPSAEELRSELENRVAQRRLFLEGVARGLDRDDLIIQRRVAQKMKIVSAELAGVEDVGEADARAIFDADPQRFTPPVIISLTQLTFKRGRGGEIDAEAAARATLGQLSEGSLTLEAATADPSMLPRKLARVDPTQIAGSFGQVFAERVAALPVGAPGVVASEFGWHVVVVEGRWGAEGVTYEQVAGLVTRELVHERRVAAELAFGDALKRRYPVRYEGVDPVELGLEDP